MEACSFKELFSQIKINFWLTGIPFDDPNIYFRFHFMVLILVIVIIEEFSFFIKRYSPENLLELTQLTPCLCIGVLSLLKIVPIVVRRENIFELSNSLDLLHSKILDKPRTRELIQNKMLMMKHFLKYFIILNTLLVTVYNVYSIVLMVYLYVKKKELIFHLPYGVVLPFSTDMWATWFLVYLQLIFAGYICVLFFTAVDELYCVLTLHICNNFTVITDEISNLDENNMERLRDLVENHQNVLRLSEDLEKIFQLPNLFSVLVGSLEICALGFNLTVGSWSQVPGCVLFLSSVIMQILLMSVFGENLIRESRKVGEAAFLSKWYNMDEKSKKIMLIIMKRSNKPQRLTAYKFSVICYESFTKVGILSASEIISTSWSYFTILRTVYKPPENVPFE